MRAVIVVAVSTGAQATEEKYSIPQQLEACQATCQQRGWTVAHEITLLGHSRNCDWLHEIVRDSEGYGQWVQLVESEAEDLVVCRDYDRLWRTDALRALGLASSQWRETAPSASAREERRQVLDFLTFARHVDPAELVAGDVAVMGQ